jgi:hypothetical protein
MIFSIVGKLTASDAIDTASTSASIKVKDGEEWTTIDLDINPGDQTVEGGTPADQTGVTSLPVYFRGTFTDQVMASAGISLKYTVTKNSITMFDGENPPQDITVVEVKNADGNPADENGPWELIVRAKYDDNTDNDPIPYTGRFYVSKTFDNKLSPALGSAQVKDLFFGDSMGPAGEAKLTEVVSSLGSAKAYVAPYCATTNVTTTGIYPTVGGYSPLFTDAPATANAKAATELKAISGFTLVLK